MTRHRRGAAALLTVTALAALTACSGDSGGGDDGGSGVSDRSRVEETLATLASKYDRAVALAEETYPDGGPGLVKALKDNVEGVARTETPATYVVDRGGLPSGDVLRIVCAGSGDWSAVQKFDFINTGTLRRPAYEVTHHDPVRVDSCTSRTPVEGASPTS